MEDVNHIKHFLVAIALLSVKDNNNYYIVLIFCSSRVMVMNKFFPVSNNCFAKQKGFKAKFERLK